MNPSFTLYLGFLAKICVTVPSGTAPSKGSSHFTGPSGSLANEPLERSVNRMSANVHSLPSAHTAKTLVLSEAHPLASGSSNVTSENFLPPTAVHLARCQYPF